MTVQAEATMHDACRSVVLWVLSISLAGVGVVALSALLLSGPGDGFEEGKNYGLAKTYPVKIEVGLGKTILGRQFDFTDANVGNGGVVRVPEKDPVGRLNVFREDDSLPVSTVRKDRVKVPGRTIDGVSYPAYEFIEWRFRMRYREFVDLDNIPMVKPKR